MSPRNPPLLSVVVPIYNVGSYLAPCLDSILASSLTDLEVICINDGSTDRSGDIADAYAADDSRLRVVHVPNGGLGSARNLGTAEAAGRYLAFADSDDRIPYRAYEYLCESLEQSDSDFATGRVRRFSDSSSWSSGLHRMAIPSARRRTHISRMPSLVYDTTAWNKVFRRSFWDGRGLTFPTGVLYEDIPVMIPAHALAEAVDVLTAEVYEWRDRGDETSITQQRSDLKNVRDRLGALEQVNDFLVEHASEKVLRAHIVKVLSLDMPLYVAALDTVSDEYLRYFSEHMETFMEQVPVGRTASLNPWDRVAYELLRLGRPADVVQLVRQRKQQRSEYAVRRRGKRTYADLPFLGDAAVGIPDSVYEVTRTLPARAVVDELTVDGGTLTLSGYAFVKQIRLQRPWDAVRFLQFRTSKGEGRLRWPVLPRRRQDVTAEFGTEETGYDYAGFSARVPLKRLMALTGDGYVDVSLGHVSRGMRRVIGVTLAARSDLEPAALVELDGGRYLCAYSGSGDVLRLALRTAPPVVTAVRFVDEDVLIDVKDPAATPGNRLVVGSAGDTDPVSVALEPVPDSPLRRARVPIAALGMRPTHHAQNVWRATIEPPTGTAGRPRHLLAQPDLPDVTYRDSSGTRELAARIGGGGRFLLTDRRATVLVAAASWDAGHLVVELIPPVPHADDVRYELVASGREGLEPVSVVADGERVTVRFPIFEPGRDRSIAPVTWLLRALTGDEIVPDKLPFEVERSAKSRFPGELADGLVRVRVIPSRRLLRVVVRSGRVHEAGKYNQAVGQQHYARRAVRRPLTDKILLQSWAGKQFSCSPRAIYEELARRGRADDAVWVRRTTDVDMPQVVHSVLFGSHEYFDTLATARLVVANDAMPEEYLKREGSTYLQTWHGTPLKRIGFDIENPQFSDPTYLDRFAADVARWDALVSPNAYSSEIFRRAFRYEGRILETGYPRNDVFHAADAPERRAQVRERLGLRPGQRAVLWAPTWRDNQRDKAGRYRLAMPFGFGTWNSLLAADDVLLFRGHQLMLATMGDISDASHRLRNVTAYPDIQDLYLAADVLITDYSSVMFDFANTRRPMIFFAWDLDAYRDELRGFYVDYEAEVPGPLVTNLEELRATLADVTGAVAATSGRYDAFLTKYCSLEDGHAAQRVVDALLS